MNTVFLLFSIGVFALYTAANLEISQVNQLDNSSRENAPKYLWDPDKRMWVESDDEDFYVKGYSGDGNGSATNDFAFLDSADNENDPIEEEGIDEELFTINDKADPSNSSQERNSLTTINPMRSIIAPPAVNVNLGGNTTVDLVKFEEKASSTLANPLNQTLDPPTANENHNGGDCMDEKADESHANFVIEVNPATDSPLWALEFESKRTKPLQKEETTLNTTQLNADEHQDTPKLHVIPLEDIDSEDKTPDNIHNSNIINNSQIIQIQPLSKDSTNNIAVELTELDQSYQRNAGVDHPEHHSSENVSNETKVPKQTNTQHNIKSGSSSNNKSPVKGSLLVQTTTIKPYEEPVPEVVLPENPSDKDRNIAEEEVSSNNTNIGGQNNVSAVTPLSNKTSSEIPSAINKTSTLSTSLPINTKRNDTNTTGITNLPAPSKPCLPTITTSGNTTLHWPETPVNVTIIPEELCLKQDGTPVTRTCLNGVWSTVNGTCHNNEPSARTRLLTELLNPQTPDSNNISKTLSQITRDTSNVTCYEVHLMSRLLEKVVDSPKTDDVDQVVKSISNMMHIEPRELKQAQSTLNSTDKILYSLDDCLLKTNLPESGYRSVVTEKLLVQEANFQKTNFSGFKVVSNGNSFQADDVSALHILNISSTDLELALFVPEELKNAIKQCHGSQNNPNIISSVFYDDTLFNSNETQGHSVGKIISVLLPGFNCSFPAPLQIIFKPPNNSNHEHKCAYWRYGSNEHENIKGHWFVEEKPKQYLNTSLQLCEFSHATHFSLLVMGDMSVYISEADTKALNIITAVGSGLSLLGLLAIFLTAIAFKTYRSANAVVIHFSVAMAAQIVLLYMADHMSDDVLMCTIFGAALHYVVLSQFCWMLTIALLQYKRYVLVFSNPTKYLMAKACGFAWGLPLVPVIALMSITTDSYGRNTYGICYAIGNYFIFGVLIPVALIVFINLLVFLRIMIYIASRKIKAHRKMDNATSLQLRLAIMLYFLLGLTWGFGLIAAIGAGVVYSYLFCITATLQGFVLFLFFIALSDKTRALWGTTIWCPCLDKKKKYDVNTDSSSHPMVRRPTSTNTSDTCTDGTGNDVFHKYKNRSSMDF